MARLTKQQAKQHQQACDLLTRDRLTYDEREFVINHWQESATNVNTSDAAFFTPLELSFHLVLEIGGCESVIDLCAGVGSLAFAAHRYGRGAKHIVCIEKNPAYVEVGRKVMPEAEWICGDVQDAIKLGRRFQMAISNPPFGNIVKINGPRYSGKADLAVVDIAAQIADFGAFILPSMSVPFKLSGQPYYSRVESREYEKFHKLTGIELTAGCGVDCAIFKNDWRFVAPSVEIACAEFPAVSEQEPSLFDLMAA